MPTEFDIKRLAEIPDPLAAESNQSPYETGLAPAPPASSTRSRVRLVRALAAAAAVVYQVGWLIISGLRPDLKTLSAAAVALGLATPLGAAAFALAGAIRKGTDGLGERASRLAVLLVSVPALFAVVTILTKTRDAIEVGFWSDALHCMMATTLLTLGPLAVGAWAFRYAFASASAWRTAALGIACGALAAGTMSLACPSDDAFHIVIGHGTSMLLGGALGSLLGLRFTRA